jgi:FkbM family methyltransferase
MPKEPGSPMSRALKLPTKLLSYYHASGLARTPVHAALRAGASMTLRIAGAAVGLHLTEHPFASDTLRMFAGEYEAEFCQLIRDSLRPGDTALDVGANIGFITRVMAEAVGERGRVVAFEPNFKLFALAVRNVAKYSQALVLPVGLSDQPGSAEFHVARDSMATGSLHQAYVQDSVPPWDRRVEAMRVQLAQGSDLIASFGVERFSLLKIDVEGHEIAVLNGLRRAIDRCENLVALVEAWLPAQRAAGHSDEALYDCLTGMGFSVAGQADGGAFGSFTNREHYGAFCRELSKPTMLYCTKGARPV